MVGIVPGFVTAGWFMGIVGVGGGWDDCFRYGLVEGSWRAECRPLEKRVRVPNKFQATNNTLIDMISWCKTGAQLLRPSAGIMAYK